MEDSKVIVIDSPCGAGKTSWAIRYMKEKVFDSFIFITPFLSELDRIKIECTNRKFNKPNEKLGRGSKTNHFYELLENKKNIVSTHSLFKGISQNVIDKIEEGEYILILDEVMDVIEDLHVSPSDINILLSQGTITVDENEKVHWMDDNYDGKFTSLKNSCKNGDVYLFDNSMILWCFPASIFKSFKKIFILTYMFSSQIQRYYYDMNEVEYTYKSVRNINNKYELYDYKYIGGSKYKDLIHIYDGKLNDIGKNTYALSKSWYIKADKHEIMDELKRNTENYFRNIIKGKSCSNMWTAFKDYKESLKGKGYTKGYISCNARATNLYRDRTNLAYLINVYNNPMINRFFINKGVKIEENKYALSYLIQWLFRSAIRDEKEINLYIPSRRMRELLTTWLNETHQK